MSINSTLDSYKKKYGGLWVGGTLLVTDAKIIFQENILNKMVHTTDNGFSIPLTDVALVERVFGFLTGIIIIKTKDSIFKVRCFGAKNTAQRINELLHS